MKRLMSLATLLCAPAWAAESSVAGKWQCTNIPDQGSQSPWRLTVQKDGNALNGILTDGEAELRLSDLKADAATLTFGFQINGKPYTFEGKIDGKRLEGRYSGAEARGKLRCEKTQE